jgi:hypothetical protein
MMSGRNLEIAWYCTNSLQANFSLRVDEGVFARIWPKCEHACCWFILLLIIANCNA